MSLPSQSIAPIPDETRRVAEAAFPRGNVYMQMRDLLGTIYTDEMFAGLYPEDGQPALRPWRLALITVMQFCENLTDRQAADAVRDRVSWKYALSLELSDSGFNFSVLSEFRERLLAHDGGQELLDQMLEVLRAQSLLKSHRQQRTDSTHILAAIKKRNQFELVHETLRYTLNEIARYAPDWLKSWVPEEWFERYSKRTSNYVLPKGEAERQAWAQQIGQDGMTLLEKLDQYRRQNDVELPDVVPIMQKIWIQNYYYKENSLYLREKEDQPPSSQRIASPYDTEARYSTKRETQWVGYKVHLTETCEANHPHFITHVETCPATQPDTIPLDKIHAALAQRNCLPEQHLVDQGYMSVEWLVNSRETYQIEMIGLIPSDNSWQAREGGYDSSCFTIDWEQQQAICP